MDRRGTPHSGRRDIRRVSGCVHAGRFVDLGTHGTLRSFVPVGTERRGSTGGFGDKHTKTWSVNAGSRIPF
ncbi:MAG: hypothetical protein LBD01_00755 [Puniceicoccales bacterium]|nr:hypothetical protein [Puniceicoccales bacterium]